MRWSIRLSAARWLRSEWWPTRIGWPKRDQVQLGVGGLVGGRRSGAGTLSPLGVPVGADLPLGLGFGERAGGLVDADLDLEPGRAQVGGGPVAGLRDDPRAQARCPSEPGGLEDRGGTVAAGGAVDDRALGAGVADRDPGHQATASIGSEVSSVSRKASWPPTTPPQRLEVSARIVRSQSRSAAICSGLRSSGCPGFPLHSGLVIGRLTLSVSVALAGARYTAGAVPCSDESILALSATKTQGLVDQRRGNVR